MSTHPSDPYAANLHPGGCWVCTHWHGRTNGDWRALVCEREAHRGIITVNTLADRGCCYWEREPGADDEIPPPCARNAPT